MPHVVKEPSRELRRLATRIEVGIGIYLSGRDADAALGSEWESLRYAWTLTNLAVRHAEATALLARTDAVLAPTAFVTARAAMETAARTLWLLEPDDSWEREARWLALLREGARLGTRHQVADDAVVRARAETIGAFADAVEAKLPEGVNVPGTPSADAILARYGTGLDSFYVIASQFMHGAELATRSYRVNVGNAAEYGELSTLHDWILPLSHAWQAATAGVLRLMQASGASVPPAFGRVERQVQEALTDFATASRAED